MFKGSVVSIHISRTVSGPVEPIENIDAVAGRGLEGDRYFVKAGAVSKPEIEITLIESEAMEALRRDYEIELAPGESRRNITTRDVPLNHLVGRNFKIGEVLCRGIKLCEPCGHLERLTGKDVITSLKHRGGLRAQILTSGEIQVGDSIEEV